MCVCLLGAIVTSFLPETIGAKLPDTVKVKLSDLLLIHKIKIKMFSFQDSNLFGRSDDYLSFKPLRQQKPTNKTQLHWEKFQMVERIQNTSLVLLDLEYQIW